MDKTAKFWDRVAKRYSKQPIADEASYQKKLQLTREYLKSDMEVAEFSSERARAVCPVILSFLNP